MRYRFFRRKNSGLYYFQFLLDNDAPILTSQGYENKNTRNKGLNEALDNAPNAENYQLAKDDNDKYLFILNTSDGKKISHSVSYNSQEEAEQGARIFMQESEQLKTTTSTPTNELASTTTTTTTTTTSTSQNPYTAEGKEDNYKPLSFYEQKITGPENGFGTFEEDNYYYFTYNRDGIVYMIGEGYESVGARDNGINSVATNFSNASRYQRMVHPNGKHYFNLRAGNNKEIATSRWFDSLGAMNAAITGILEGTSTILSGRVEEGTNLAAANRIASISIAQPIPTGDEGTKKRKKKKKRTTEKKEKKERVIIEDGNYLFNKIKYQIFKSSNDRYYFIFRDKNDKTLFLNSNVRGYGTEEEVRQAVQEVIQYAPYEGNYEGKIARNGKYYFYVKNEKGENLGKSFFYNSDEDMQASVGSLLGRTFKVAAADTAQLQAQENARLAALAAAEAARAKAEEEARIAAEAARAKAEEEARIAAEAARAKAEEEARIAAEAARAKAEEEARIAAEAARAKAEEEARIAAEAEAERKRIAAAALAARRKKELRTDDYLTCKAYAGEPSFYSFRHEETGEYYFAYNHPQDGTNTLLRSEGYKSAAARDNGIESVKKNAPIDSRWKEATAMDEKYHYYLLKAGNGQEIARSCYYRDRAAMLIPFGFVRGEESPIGIGSAVVGGALFSAAMLTRKREEEERAAAAAALAAKQKAAAEEAARLKRIEEEKAAAAALAAKQKAEAERRQKEEADKKAAAIAAAAAAAAALAAKQKAAAEEAARLKRIEEEKAAAAALAAKQKAEAEKRQKEEAAKKAAAVAAAAAAAALAAKQKAAAAEAARLKKMEEERAAAAALAAKQKAEAERRQKEEAAKKAAAVAAAALAAKEKAAAEELEVFAATTTPAAANIKTEAANKAAYAEREAAAATTAGGSGIWPWILGLLLLLALLYFFRGCFGCGGDNKGVAGVDKVPPKKEVVAPPVVLDTIETIKKEPETKPAEMEKTVPLGPDAAALGFTSGTTLAKIADFLANPNSNLPQTFSWTDGNYPLNSAKMSAAGKAQMDDFAKIMKAYPNTKFNFYNYLGDNENSKYTGPATDAQGLTLADVRARCPVKKIAKYGVSESRMSFKGRGKSTPFIKDSNLSGNRRGKLTEIEIVVK